MTDVVLHHVAYKQSGQEDTHYRIDQIKVVGFRRIEIIRQEVLYPVYDDFQYQCGECRKDTYKETENQYELLFLDILFAPYDEALQQTPLVLCHFPFYSRIILMTPPLPNLMMLDGFGRPVSSWRYPTI